MAYFVHPNGDLSVPRRAESDGIIGDGLVRLVQGSAEWQKWFDYAERTGDEPSPFENLLDEFA